MSSKWRPIVTAPKDGTGILGYAPGYLSTFEVKWSEYDEPYDGMTGRWVFADYEVYDGFEPEGLTHWIPIPGALDHLDAERIDHLSAVTEAVSALQSAIKACGVDTDGMIVALPPRKLKLLEAQLDVPAQNLRSTLRPDLTTKNLEVCGVPFRPIENH